MLRTPGSRLKQIRKVGHSKSEGVGIVLRYDTFPRDRAVSRRPAISLDTADARMRRSPGMRRRRHHRGILWSLTAKGAVREPLLKSHGYRFTMGADPLQQDPRDSPTFESTLCCETHSEESDRGCVVLFWSQRFWDMTAVPTMSEQCQEIRFQISSSERKFHKIHAVSAISLRCMWI